MRFFYRMLLRLYPARVREEFGLEMEEVFAEAWEGRRAQGGAAAVLFVCREVLGAVGGAVGSYSLPQAIWRYKWNIVGAALLGLFAGAWQGGALLRTEVESKAVLRLSEPVIPESLVAQPGQDAERTLREVTQRIQSRTEQINLINTYQLYARERRRMPLEEVLEKMREAMRIHMVNDRTMEISFRYEDRFLAQKLTEGIATKLVDRYLEESSLQTAALTEFFQTQLREAAEDWDRKSKNTQSAGAGERQRFDLELAKKRYEVLSYKLADAKMAEALRLRKQGSRLEVLDSATLPYVNWLLESMSPLVGGFVGLLFGTMLAWFRQVMGERRRRKTLLAAQ